MKMKSRWYYLIIALFSLHFSTGAKADFPGWEPTKWVCEASGLLVYSEDGTCEIYSCQRNRQFGEPRDTLEAAMEASKARLMSVAKQAGVKFVRDVEVYQCTQGSR